MKDLNSEAIAAMAPADILTAFPELPGFLRAQFRDKRRTGLVSEPVEDPLAWTVAMLAGAFNGAIFKSAGEPIRVTGDLTRYGHGLQGPLPASEEKDG